MRALKRDTAEAAIVEAIEAAGWLVYRLHTPCDLLCVKPSMEFASGGGVERIPLVALLEVKTGKRKPHKSQEEFIKLTGVPVVRTPEEALSALEGL
jgi:hypothetical protein